MNETLQGGGDIRVDQWCNKNLSRSEDVKMPQIQQKQRSNAHLLIPFGFTSFCSFGFSCFSAAGPPRDIPMISLISLIASNVFPKIKNYKILNFDGYPIWLPDALLTHLDALILALDNLCISYFVLMRLQMRLLTNFSAVFW